MKNIAFTVVALAATIVALLLPNRFTENSRAMYANSERVRARITEVDNSTVRMIGPVKQGEQQLEMTVLSGKFKGRTFRSTNNLVGKIELDKLYSAGDFVLAVLDLTGPKSDQGSDVLYATVFDHYRTGKTVALALLFFGLLILVTGSVGVKTVISFVFTGAMIVKVLFPAMLDGADPVIASFAVTTALTAAITLLVGGVNRRGFAAFAGPALGVLATADYQAGLDSVGAQHVALYDRHNDHHAAPCLLGRVHRHADDVHRCGGRLHPSPGKPKNGVIRFRPSLGFRLRGLRR